MSIITPARILPLSTASAAHSFFAYIIFSFVIGSSSSSFRTASKHLDSGKVNH